MGLNLGVEEYRKQVIGIVVLVLVSTMNVQPFALNIAILPEVVTRLM